MTVLRKISSSPLVTQRVGIIALGVAAVALIIALLSLAQAISVSGEQISPQNSITNNSPVDVVTPLNGTNGLNGIDGLTGATGATGAKGDKGDRGRIGPAGEKGQDGSAIGIQGIQGETGPQGPQGELGPMGPQGPAGASGSSTGINIGDPCTFNHAHQPIIGVVVWIDQGNKAVIECVSP
jgi:hypothetical protein